MIELSAIILLLGFLGGLSFAAMLSNSKIKNKAKSGRRLSIGRNLYNITLETEGTKYSDRLKRRIGPGRMKACPFCGSTHPELSQHNKNCYLRLYSETISCDEYHNIDVLTKAWGIRFVNSFKGDYNRQFERIPSKFPRVNGTITKRVLCLKKEDNQYFVFLKTQGFNSEIENYRDAVFEDILPLFWIPEEDNEYITYLFSAMGYDIQVSIDESSIEHFKSTVKSTKEGE